jgi:hypothetical protein
MAEKVTLIHHNQTGFRVLEAEKTAAKKNTLRPFAVGDTTPAQPIDCPENN